MKWFLKVAFITCAFLFCISGTKSYSSGAKTSGDDYYVLMLIIDGLNPVLFEKMINKGDLPNIKEYVYDKGLTADNFITIFPSITLPAISSIMTGVYPSKHKIPAFQWFDRKKFMYRSYIGLDINYFNRDIHKNTKTIYNYLEKNESASFGLAVQSPGDISKGLISSYFNPLRKIEPSVEFLKRDILTSLNLRNGMPRFTVFYDWDVILESYEYGVDNPRTRMKIINSDKQLGRLIKEYRKRGILDKTYIVVLSDHGLISSDKSFYVDEMLRDKGFHKRRISYNLGDYYVPFSFNPKETYPLVPFSIERVDALFGLPIYHKGYTVIFGSNAGGAACLYFAQNGGFGENGKWSKENWKQEVLYKDMFNYYLGPKKGYFNIIDYIKKIDGVHFFIVRDNEYNPNEEFKVRIISKAGMSMITSKGASTRQKVYKYELISGTDPISYTKSASTKKLMDGKFHSGEDWFIASTNHDFPDACVQLSQILENTESGSMIISVSDTWGINSKVSVKHGDLMPGSMRAMFSISGPGINKGRIGRAKTVDVTPSILHILNKSFNKEDFDGNVIPQIKEAVLKRNGK